MKRPPVFLREATGLVRELGVKDLVFFNLENLTFGVGISYVLFFLFLTPGADPVLATFLTGLLFVPLGIIYAMVITAMPRSGSDYVFVSRALHPVFGYILNFTFCVWLFFWVGAFVNWIFTAGFGPTFSLIGSIEGNPSITALASTVTSNNFVMAAGILLLIVLGVAVTVSKRSLFRILNASVAAGIISVVLIIFTLATNTNADFISRFNTYSAPFAGTADYYHGLISAANIPVSGFSWTATVSLIPVAAWIFMYYAAQQTVGGEIKNVRRTSYLAMILTIVIGISFCVTVIYLAENVMGYRFLQAIAAMSGTSAYTIPIATPYYNYLVGVLVTNPILLWIMGLLFIGWDIALVMLNFVMVPRYLLASSMDRITPGFLANVSDRFHTPYAGIWLVVLCGSIMLVLYTSFAGFFATLSAVLGEMIAAYLLFSIAAIVFPLRKGTKALFDASPVAWRVAGVPVLSILGCISTVVLLSIGYMFLMNSMYGVNSVYSLVGIVLIVIGAVTIFTTSYTYNKKHGLDIMLGFKQLPPE